MGDFFNTIMAPIEWLVAWIMYGFHQALTWLGMDPAGGWTWALSIVGLVVVMRAAMIPLFVKQIMASRKMQMIQPELQKIQKKYKGKSDPESRQAMTQETMELYKKEGTNPFSSCLPILVQSPFFFGLFSRAQRARRDRRRDQGTDRPDHPAGGRPVRVGDDLRGAAVRHLPRLARLAQRQDRHVRPHRPHVGDDVPHPAPADDEEHAGVRARQPLRQAAEAPALRPPGRVRRLRRQLPDRCPHLLVHDEPLVDVPAVLRHPPDAGPRLGRREGRTTRAWPRRASRSPAPPPRGGHGGRPRPRRRRRPPASGCSRPRRRSARRARPAERRPPGKNPGAAPKPPTT